MNPRPIPVTLIGWILIVLGVFSLVGMPFFYRVLVDPHSQPAIQAALARNPLPLKVQVVMMGIALTISLLAGSFLLRGANWARFLYVGWSLLSFLIGLCTAPAKLPLIPGFLVFLLITYFLFNTEANAYFEYGRKKEPLVEPGPPPRIDE